MKWELLKLCLGVFIKGRDASAHSLSFHCSPTPQAADLKHWRSFEGWSLPSSGYSVELPIMLLSLRRQQLEFTRGSGTPLQYSYLGNPMDRGAWWAAVHEVAKSPTRLSDFTLTCHFHALEKEMVTYSSVLAWRIPGTGKPGGLPSMGSHRVRQNWSDLGGVGGGCVRRIVENYGV